MFVTGRSRQGGGARKENYDYDYDYDYEYIPDYGHLPPRFVPRVVRAEWAWIPTSRAAAAGALVVCVLRVEVSVVCGRWGCWAVDWGVVGV